MGVTCVSVVSVVVCMLGLVLCASGLSCGILVWVLVYRSLSLLSSIIPEVGRGPVSVVLVSRTVVCGLLCLATCIVCVVPWKAELLAECDRTDVNVLSVMGPVVLCVGVGSDLLRVPSVVVSVLIVTLWSLVGLALAV